MAPGKGFQHQFTRKNTPRSSRHVFAIDKIYICHLQKVTKQRSMFPLTFPNIAIPETSILFQIVLKEGGHQQSSREIKYHKMRLLLKTVDDEFFFVLEKKFELINKALKNEGSCADIESVIQKEFSKSPTNTKKLCQIVEDIVKCLKERGLGYLRACNALGAFKLEILSQYDDTCNDFALHLMQAQRTEHEEEKRRLVSGNSQRLVRNLKTMDIEIVSEGVAVKKQRFADSYMSLITTDPMWRRLIPYLRRHGITVKIMPQSVGD